MKSLIKKAGGLVLAAMVVFGFISCQQEPEHEHTFSTKWKSDETYHWHAATCEHTDEVSEKAEHSWNSGEVTTAAACLTKGVKTYICKVCKATKTEEIAATGHNFATEWTSDETNHWHTATCEHTTEVSGKAEHTYGDWDSTSGKRICTICKYEQSCEHTWNGGEVITAATYFTKGEEKYICTVCNATKTEEIAELYSTPVDAETGLAATSDSTYIYFGVFPKTVLASTSTVTVDESTSVTMGANTYYKGSDGEYYAKVTENPYDSYYTYSDDSTVSSGSTRYFKVEPIKWRVLTNDYNSTGKALLLAEDILTANVPYYVSISSREIGEASVYANNYKYSTIRAYLNGSYESDDTQTTTYKDKGFLQTAFTAVAQELIATTTVDNSGESTTDATGSLIKADGTNSSFPTDYTCANTNDKIFLLSEKEVTTTGNGFESYSSTGKGNARIRVNTDYAKANYAYQYTTAGYGGWWWLRSPLFLDSNNALGINASGLAECDFEVKCTDGGIVPALCISF